MDSFWVQVFSWVCGQNPEHTWAPAGDLLPMCQRCTGFYAGAAAAFLLLLLFRPKADWRYRLFHTILVLAMTPFGFHLVPQGALIRTLSGMWFGFGVVGLLWIFPGRRLLARKRPPTAAKYLHPGLGLVSIILLPVFACRGGTPAAMILPWLAFLGLASLAGLLTANIALFFCRLFNPLIQRAGRQPT